ncbi:ATP-binding protein [Parvibaculum sp.]|uniref:ATP-binding protein n=1 Tax=Parvibaculum sp. TaxID=2024848 RepID=UPI0025D2486F|nr:ATP-binding protein [Parvibaculum sp.]
MPAGEAGLRNPKAAVQRFFNKAKGSWFLLAGETETVECKHTFNISSEEKFVDSIRTVAGLANNSGGYIFFGVEDRTMSVVGLSNNFFADTDISRINRSLASALDPAPQVTKFLLELGNKKVGVLHVEKCLNAPIIATKNIGKELREGTIYYRYSGETRPIRPGELRHILAMREQRTINNLSRRIGRIASGSEATIDLGTGEVHGKGGTFVIDKSLLSHIQFLREGDFTEVRGAPALRLIGDVKPLTEADGDEARVIRESITPDMVIRTFLRNDPVSAPIQFIQVQAHFQRRWLPIWYYARQTRLSIDEIIEALGGQVATHPSSRREVVKRLRKKTSAYHAPVGRSMKLLQNFIEGDFKVLGEGTNDSTLASAIIGLPDGALSAAEFLREPLIEALDRATERPDSNCRSLIYRAACRIDEILNISRTV